MKQLKTFFRVINLLTVWFGITLLRPDSLLAQAVSSDKENGLQLIQIKEGFTESNLFGHLNLFSTSDSSLTIEEVLKRDKDFRLFNKELLSVGKDNRNHWVRFDVRNVGRNAQSLVSNLHYKEINELSFYVLDERGQIILRQENFNRKTPISKKPILTRFYAFPFDIQPGQSRTIYLRARRNHSVFTMPLKLYSKKSYSNYLFKADFLLYFAMGIIAVAFVLTSIFYLATRRPLLLYYSAYALFYGLSIANLEGLFPELVNFKIPFLDENTNIVFLSIAGLFMTLFSTHFLDIKSYAPGWVIKAAKGFIYISSTFIVYAWLTPFSGFNASLASLLGLFPMILVAIMIVYGVLNRKYEAFVYLFAITPMFAISMWFLTSVIFRYPRTWLFFDASHYSSLFEIVILGAGIGYKLVKERDEYLLQLNRIQKQFTSSILQTQDIERQRIAADLHDDLGGTLATIKRSITDLMAESTTPETLRKFENLEPLIQKSSDDLRRISHNLMPPEFERIGLSGSLSQLIVALPRVPTKFEYLCSGTEHRFGKDIELNAYRIVSELIQNILKHAQAKRAAVQLIYFSDFLRILVEDDGLGSNSDKSNNQFPGLGLKNCILRADYIGAQLTRETSSGGSLIILDTPYHSTTDESTGQKQPI